MSKEDVDNAKPFNASSGWFCNYMKKYNIDSIKMRGEAASAVAAEEFVNTSPTGWSFN